MVPVIFEVLGCIIHLWLIILCCWLVLDLNWQMRSLGVCLIMGEIHDLLDINGGEFRISGRVPDLVIKIMLVSLMEADLFLDEHLWMIILPIWRCTEWVLIVIIWIWTLLPSILFWTVNLLLHCWEMLGWIKRWSVLICVIRFLLLTQWIHHLKWLNSILLLFRSLMLVTCGFKFGA